MPTITKAALRELRVTAEWIRDGIPSLKQVCEDALADYRKHYGSENADEAQVQVSVTRLRKLICSLNTLTETIEDVLTNQPPAKKPNPHLPALIVERLQAQGYSSADETRVLAQAAVLLRLEHLGAEGSTMEEIADLFHATIMLEDDDSEPLH